MNVKYLLKTMDKISIIKSILKIERKDCLFFKNHKELYKMDKFKIFYQ